MIRSLEHQQLAVTFAPSLESARRAREFVRAGLHQAGVDEPLLADRLSLVTSELVTNAVVHAGTDIGVRITLDGPDIWVEVSDEAPTRPHRSPATVTETSGRGLLLIEALVDAWGVDEVKGGQGKMVWIRISGD